MITVLQAQHSSADVAPQTPVAPTPAPAPPPIAYTPVPVRIVQPGGNPTQTYQAAIEQRRELKRIRDGVDEERRQLSRQLQQPAVDGANRAGLEMRIRHLDQRLIELDQQVAQSEAAVAASAGVPGAVPPPPPEPLVDEDFAAVMIVILIVGVILPIGIAHARRIWKRAGTTAAAIPQALVERFARLETNVDAIAVEVERISEGQRFMAKLSLESSQRAVGQGVGTEREPSSVER